MTTRNAAEEPAAPPNPAAEPAPVHENSPCTHASEAHQNHPLVAGRHFFTLPRALLDFVVAAVGEAFFNRALLALDRALANATAVHPDVIGLRAGVDIVYDLLGSTPAAGQSSMAELMKLAQAHAPVALAWITPRVTGAVTQAMEWIEWSHQICRGYAGWLALCTSFIAEQAAFFARWHEAIQRFGIDGPSPDPTNSMTTPLPGSPKAQYITFATARDAFCQRWHLLGLAGPFLPKPARPQFPLADPQLAAASMRLSTMMSLPFIFPVPSRDQMREMTDAALSHGRTLPTHLKDWMELVSADTQGKKSIDRYARIFRLQHYWRVLYSRHADALEGKADKVRLAFTRFLVPDMAGASDEDVKSSADAVRKDLGALASVHGGSDWYLQPSAYDRL